MKEGAYFSRAVRTSGTTVVGKSAVRTIVLLLFLLVIPFFFFPLSSSGEETKNVLVLHSYHKGLSWTDSLVRGIDEGFGASGLSVSISHEFMDTKRLFSEEYLQRLAKLYQLKYRNSDIDIVLSTDDHAFNFLRRHHRQLFPETPVVFCGVNNFSPEMVADQPLFTGVLEAFDIDATLKTVLKLHSDVRRFVVISDQTLTGRANMKLFLEAVKRVDSSLQLLILDNHTMAEVQEQVGQLGEGDIAFWLTFTADREGTYFSFRDSARLISEASRAPLYSFWDFHLGFGITGGKLTSGYFQGEKATELAARILRGEEVSTMPVVTDSPNRYMFDYRQLERFHISLEALPEGSIVINRPRTLYSQHKGVVRGVVGGFLVLSIFILLLLFNISSRKSANLEITRARNRFQRMFDEAAVALFEMEFTVFFEHLIGIQDSGHPSLQSYFKTHPEELRRVAGAVRMLDCNRAALSLYGAAGREELFPSLESGYQIFGPDGFLKIVEGFEDGRLSLEWEAVISTLYGAEKHVLLSMNLVYGLEDRPPIMISVVDITERKRYLEDIRVSEDRFRTLFDSAASGMAMVDLDGAFIRVNAACSSMFGYSRQELERKRWQDITHPDDIAKTRELVVDLLKGKVIHPLEKRYLHRGGRIVWALINIGLNYGPDGRPQNYVTQMQDITEIKNVQQRMRLKDQRYRQLFEADLSGFYTAAPGGEVLLCNQVFTDILGFSGVDEVVGLNISGFYRNREFWYTTVEDLRHNRKIENCEVELIRKGNRRLTVLLNAIGRFDPEGQLLEIQGHMINISHQKKLETQLVRAQKMEAMGLMAGGVAHDLNNILSGITGYPELMLATLPNKSPLRRPLESIRASGQRAAAVVADLLTVARSAANVREVHNVYTLAREYLNSPECRQLKELYPKISLELRGGAENVTILCSPIHINKCLMNLVTNGMEAIEGSGRVVVRVSAGDGDGFLSETLPAAESVSLSVRDTGLGISEEDKSHIFEPFYTKKVMGKSGTGIGLAVVWNTVRDHGGKIQVDSDGSGTIFTLLFPYHIPANPLPEKTKAGASLEGNGEHILVVDDEPVLRDIARQILENLHYRVDTVGSGEEALSVLQEGPVDLIVLDMLMSPGINGCETYEKIVRRYPGQKAIIVSGFSKSDDVKRAMELGVGGFIEKPYTGQQLGKAVRELLGAGSGTLSA